ncbi:uncharacterized protein LOC105219538 [Zeugodacus cucurbitae]|uniref:Exocyst complex component EXO84 n=1 Tax=Zeugodacus cucurbitae TaxID=28588 RepID=A0A0A1XR56_ZEUCU|nr:uncharacterized protein LOC105219538 [Zeugodacus cucurbitae]
MSYLLTEIALEMLGYKFYDIDGNFGPTNFQHVTAGQQCQANEICAESLQTVMVLDTENENVTNVSNDGNHTENSKKSNSTDIVDKSGQERTFSAGLKKLLDLEYERLRSQVEQSIKQEAVRITDANGDRTLEKNANTKDTLKTFVLKEKEKLKTESRNLKLFRNLVETSTYKMNPDVFSQYKRVFVGSNK